MLKLVFAGTPPLAATMLTALLASKDYEIVGVFTQPDRSAGRGRKLTPSPVKTLAKQHALNIFQPADFKSTTAYQDLQALNADLMIVVAYGLLLPTAVLKLPKFGCINVHLSLLPRWRGAAPIARALLAGDTQTGISIMQMDAGLDTGPIWATVPHTIDPHATTASLTETLATLGAVTLLETLPIITQGHSKPQPQSVEGVSYAHKLVKQDGHLDWHQEALMLERCVRACQPWPVAYTSLNQQVIRVWDAKVLTATSSPGTPGQILAATPDGLDVAAKKGVLRLTQLQFPGKRMTAFKDLLNAKSALFAPGRILGEAP